MSDWIEAAEQATTRLGYETSSEAWAFLDGARWQREALLSEESIERAARALYETDRKEYDGDKQWPPWPHFIEEMYRERARAALTAAIGDE